MKRAALFTQKAHKKTEGSLFPALLFCLLAYAFLSLGQSVLFLLLSLFLGELAAPLSMLGTAAVFLPVFFYLRFFEKSSLARVYIKKEGCLWRYAFGFFFGIILAAILFSLFLLFDMYELLGVKEGGALSVFLLLLVYIVQGGAEELLCRGLCMSVLCDRLGGTGGAFVSAVAFSLLHIMNPHISLLGLLNIFLFGLLFASLTQRSQSLAPAAAMHTGWNFFLSLCGLQVSGQSAFGARLSLIKKSSFFTGAGFGPEGSPLLSVLLLLALLILAFLPPRASGIKGKGLNPIS